MCFYYQGARISEVEYLTAFNYKDADPLSPFDNDILNDLANKGMAAAVDAGNQIITAGTAAAERALDNLKGKLLLGNVYGANTLSNLQDAFNAGSINAIKPLVSGEDERDISSGAGGSIGDNLIPDTSPEIDLKSTNIFPQSENERALTPDNVYPPKSSENDERLGNINE